MENISAERTGEARLQRRGIILKLRHVDVHVYHLPFLSTHSLFAIRTLSIHQKLCRDKHSPLFKLSDAKAIRLAYVIGSVQEISLKKWKSFTNPEVFQTKNTKKAFFSPCSEYQWGPMLFDNISSEDLKKSVQLAWTTLMTFVVFLHLFL